MISKLKNSLHSLQSDTIGRFLVKAISGTFALNVLGRLIGFALMVILARLLGVEDFGIYVLAWSWGQLLLVFAKFGSDASAMRYAAQYKKTEQWSLFYGHLKYGFGLIAFKSMILLLIAALVIWVLQDTIGPKLSAALWIVLIVLPFLSAIHFVQGVLRALRLPIKGIISNTVLRPAFHIVLLGCAFLALDASQSITAPQALAMALIAGIVSLLIATGWLFKHIKSLPKSTNAAFEFKEWYKYAVLILLIASGDMIFRQTDVVMLGALASPQEAGLYSAASRIAYFVIFGISAANFVIAPMMSEFNAVKDTLKMKRLLRLSSFMIFAIALAISSVIWVGGYWILGLFGTEFQGAQSTLNILTAGQLAVTLAGPVGSLMIMTGHEKYTSKVFIVTALINIVLNALLIPEFGKDGAAIATAISFLFWNLLCLSYILGRLEINPTIFPFLDKRHDG